MLSVDAGASESAEGSRVALMWDTAVIEEGAVEVDGEELVATGGVAGHDLEVRTSRARTGESNGEPLSPRQEDRPILCADLSCATSYVTTPSTSAKSVKSLPSPTFLPGAIDEPTWRTRMFPARTTSPP